MSNEVGNRLCISFEIAGPLVAYLRVHSRRSCFGNPRVQRYNDYKQRVRLIANLAGVPLDLSPAARVSMTLWVIWKRKARADLDSIGKAILDSLWRWDRAAKRLHWYSLEHRPGLGERAIVELSID